MTEHMNGSFASDMYNAHFNRGKSDYRIGVSSLDNPYVQNSYNNREWSRGWLEAAWENT